MVGRLVFDVLWRNRWVYTVVSGLLLPSWLLYEATGSYVLEIDITALSLIFAAMLGPIFAVATMGLRELRHLPATRRDLWRTTWGVATVVSAVVVLATKTIAVLLVAASGGRPRMSAETLLISAVYDFTWAGVILTLVALPASTRAGTVVGMLACFGLPILAGGALPTHVNQLTPATTGVLIGGLVIAFGALLWTPQRGVMAGERSAFAPKALRRDSPKLQRRRADRLTGISRVAVPYLLATLALPVGASLALAAYGVVSGSGAWWFVPRSPTVFDPADIGDRGLTYFVLLPAMVTTVLGLWTPWARLLKVLPVSVRQINALLLLTPFATWVIFWILGWFAYLFVYGTPQTLRLEFVFGIAAIAALAQAGLLRLQGSAATVWVIALSGGLLPQVVRIGLRDGTGVMFVVIGAIALGTAAVVNHRTLTQSTSSSLAYRRPQPPFGVPKTAGIR